MCPVVTSDVDGVCGVVAVGGSAGGVEALRSLCAGLPADLPYAVLVALHMPRGAASVLAQILDRSGPLPAVSARDGDRLQPGRIHVGIPDHHLLVQDRHIVLSHGPTEDGHRPALNALFRSVALAFGQRAVGVLLSGVLDDGVLGLAAIRKCGGTTVVQDPRDAIFSTMPVHALQAGVADHTAKAVDIGPMLAELAARDIVVTMAQPDERMEMENRIAMGPRYAVPTESDGMGPHSGFVCPDCHGSLMALGDVGFRCRVGHAWSAEALLHARDDEVDNALWISVRSLQEKGKLSRRLATTVGSGLLFDRYTRLAEEAEHAAAVLGERLVRPDRGAEGVGA